MPTNVEQFIEPAGTKQPYSPAAPPVWLVPADPFSRAHYFLNSLRPKFSGFKTGIQVIEVTGIEDRASRDRVAQAVAGTPTRIFSLEESSGSELIRKLLIRYPGTVLVHDHLFIEPAANIAAVEACPDHLLRRELAAAEKLVFFNERALNDVIRCLPAAAGLSPEIFLSGMPAAIQPSDPGVRQNDRSIIVTADPDRSEQRAEKILAALAQLKSPPPVCWLVGAGQKETAGALAAAAGIDLAGLRFEPRGPDRFIEISHTASAAVILSTSPFGDLSPYLELSFAAGLPVIVSDFSVGSSLPDDLVFKILPGFSETAEIAGTLIRLADPNLRRGLAPDLQHYAGLRFNPAVIAAEFESILFGDSAAGSGISPGTAGC